MYVCMYVYVYIHLYIHITQPRVRNTQGSSRGWAGTGSGEGVTPRPSGHSQPLSAAHSEVIPAKISMSCFRATDVTAGLGFTRDSRAIM